MKVTSPGLIRLLTSAAQTDNIWSWGVVLLDSGSENQGFIRQQAPEFPYFLRPISEYPANLCQKFIAGTIVVSVNRTFGTEQDWCAQAHIHVLRVFPHES